jgi:1-acyl-sn-glycerol-3-phosphate acyltransferase
VPKGAVIVAMKHQSMFETTEVAVLLDTPATVMKDELTRVPLWGRLLAWCHACALGKDRDRATGRDRFLGGAEHPAQGGAAALPVDGDDSVDLGQPPP